MTSTRVAPRREDVGALGAAAIPFILSFIAGMADVTSFVLLNGLFAAHITGNDVALAADVATHQPLRLTAATAAGECFTGHAPLTRTGGRSNRASAPTRPTLPWVSLGRPVASPAG